jgi:hypothetical protein
VHHVLLHEAAHPVGVAAAALLVALGLLGHARGDEAVHVRAALWHVVLVAHEAKEDVRVRQPALLELHH